MSEPATMSVSQANTPETVTPATQVTRQLDMQFKIAADTLRRAYSFTRRTAYNNPSYPKKDAQGNVVRDAQGAVVSDSDKFFADYEANTATGMKRADVEDLAQIAKAAFNAKEKRSPIVDDCPEAIIITAVDARDLTAEDLAAIKAFAAQRRAERLGMDDGTAN